MTSGPHRDPDVGIGIACSPRLLTTFKGTNEGLPVPYREILRLCQAQTIGEDGPHKLCTPIRNRIRWP
jgi:hypothetical protein